MALQAFLDSNTQPTGGILEALTSYISPENEEDLQTILRMAHLNREIGSNSSTLGSSSTSKAVGLFASDVYFQGLGNTTVEPYISLPSYPMSFLSGNPVNNLYTDDKYSYLCQSRDKDSKRRRLGNDIGCTDLYKTKLQAQQDTFHDSVTLTPSLRKPRIEVNQGSINQQQTIVQELLLKELQECNPQMREIIKQCRQQMQVQNPIGLHLQMLKQPVRSLLQEQVNQQEIFAPLLDGGICSQRFKQYLYHLRNNRHDNDITYWKKFVSEYYAPCSKKRWCFSRYENIELHAAGIFCPKSRETWCCQLCGLKSGKGLEATFETFPRLFKMKFESSMLDEILFLDSPEACKVSHGVALEYGIVIQEGVYETFRVVHKGKLRVVFGYDLKILSWEFCIENHDEFLLRALFSPQVNQLVQAAEKSQWIQNCTSPRASAHDLRKVCETFVSEGTQILANMELPLVNDLGYPKRFIRCLQIAEVVDSMRDLMAFSRATKLGPIESLNNYAQCIKIDNQIKGRRETGLLVGAGAQNQAVLEQSSPRFHTIKSWMSENSVISGTGNSGFGLLNQNHQLLELNSSVNSARKNTPEMDHYKAMSFEHSFNLQNETSSSSSEHGKTSDSSVNKMLREMVASHRGKSVQESCNEVAKLSSPSCATSRSSAVTAPVNSTTFSKTFTARLEPCSPEELPEDFRSYFSRIDQDFSW